MSTFRFDLAKQYIQARDYDKAREILVTMPDNPTAKKWLAKLDEIDPPFPDVVPDSFSAYSSDKAKRMPQPQERNALLNEEVKKAQKGGRIAGGFLLAMGTGLIAFTLIVNPFIRPHAISTEYGTFNYPVTSADYLLTAIFIGLGLFFLCLGMYQLWYAGRTEKIRTTLTKGKAQNIKRSGLIFLGLALMFAFVGIVTKQTSQLGFSIIWAINAGIMLLYQLPKAEEFDRQQGLVKDGEKAKRSDFSA